MMTTVFDAAEYLVRERLASDEMLTIADVATFAEFEGVRADTLSVLLFGFMPDVSFPTQVRRDDREMAVCLDLAATAGCYHREIETF